MDKIPIKTVDWMEDGDFMLISNGQDALVRHNASGKELTKEVKKASYGIYHRGKIFTDKDLQFFNPESTPQPTQPKNNSESSKGENNA